MNLPEGWAVYPLMEVTIALFVILIALLIVQIMTLRVLKSFQQPPEEPPQEQNGKKQIEKLTFRDMK